MLLSEGKRPPEPPRLQELCVWCGGRMMVYERAYLRMRSLWGRVLCAPTCSPECDAGVARAPYSTEIVVGYRRDDGVWECVEGLR